jgi:hypothetical protein
VRVTEEVVKAAAANQKKGTEVVRLLLKQRASEVRVTELVVEAAAANEGCREEVMRLVLNQHESEDESGDERAVWGLLEASSSVRR